MTRYEFSGSSVHIYQGGMNTIQLYGQLCGEWEEISQLFIVSVHNLTECK
jgi:hypothetical protein